MKDKLVPWQKHSLRHDRHGDEHPFDLLHREINDLFDTYYQWGGRLDRHAADSTRFELSETDDEIRVKVELPGMDEKDIEVSLDENILVIHGEKKEQSERKKRNYHVSEMRYGSIHRSFPLPTEVDATKAEAKFKRGVLTLTFPKTERVKAERKRIPVHSD
ncbi:MAG: Hsp20/alpha crystallin family protein [Kiritimatiellales bacterium]|nr:Hsp20/alpha crystallin family protein [Kiritimatiellales bacterium]